MAETLKNRIINTLVKSLNISKQDIDEAMLLQKQKGIGLDKALIEKGLINEKEYLVMLVKELHIPFINLSKYRIDPRLMDVIPERFARKHRIIPLSRLEKTITVAIADPLDIFAIDDLKTLTSHEIDVVMCTDSDILKALDNFYGSPLTSTVKDVSKDMNVDSFEIVTEQEMAETADVGVDESEQAPIIRMVNLFIREALKQRASDIHIEPMIDMVLVRYRIDGLLREIITFPKENQNAVTVRIKIMSRLDITATRTPQDGRFKMKMANQEVDFRVSLLPTTFGQKIVLRVLD